MLKIQAIVDDAECYRIVRGLRWPDGVRCPRCDPERVTRRGHDDTRPDRRRYGGSGCRRRSDDLTGTVFAGHHQPLRVGALCLYFMGLSLSDEQIAQELDLNPDDAQRMTSLLREGVVDRRPPVALSGEVERDEVCVVAGHKGHPEAVRKKGGPGAADA